MLDPTEARQLLDAINILTPAGLRDRALIGLMVFSFARIGAKLGMKVQGCLHPKPAAVGEAAREGGQDP